MTYITPGILLNENGRVIKNSNTGFPAAAFPPKIKKVEIADVQQTELSVDWNMLLEDRDCAVSDSIKSTQKTISVLRFYVDSVAVENEEQPEKSETYRAGTGTAGNPFRNLQYALDLLTCALSSCCWSDCIKFQIVLTGTVNYTIKPKYYYNYPGGVYIYIDDQSGNRWTTSTSSVAYKDICGVQFNNIEFARKGTANAVLFSSFEGCVFYNCKLYAESTNTNITDYTKYGTDNIPDKKTTVFYGWKTEITGNTRSQFPQLQAFIPDAPHIKTEVSLNLANWQDSLYANNRFPICYFYIGTSFDITFETAAVNSSVTGWSNVPPFPVASTGSRILFKEINLNYSGTIGNENTNRNPTLLDVTAFLANGDNILRQCSVDLSVRISDTENDQTCFREGTISRVYGVESDGGTAEIYGCSSSVSVSGSTFLGTIFSAYDYSLNSNAEKCSGTATASGSITSGNYIECEPDEDNGGCANWMDVQSHLALAYEYNSGESPVTCQVTFGQQLSVPEGEIGYNAWADEICSGYQSDATYSVLRSLPEDLQ